MIDYLYLGRVDYPEALRLQQELVELRRASAIGNVLLLLEHPPVLTLGRHANRANILASDELLASRGVALHHISRGGDVTYHGPGQLIGYPIFDLRSLENSSGNRMGPVDFVRGLEETLIRLCQLHGVHAGRLPGLTGAWCASPGAALDQNGRKIGAIGIHVSRGITSHGFAFNVRTDLRDFLLINPCGITDKPVTSLELEITRQGADPAALPALETIAHQAAQLFAEVFRRPLRQLESIEALRNSAARAAGQSPPNGDRREAPVREEEGTTPSQKEFPAEDTPLQVPPELEHLRGAPHRPVRT